MNVTFLNAPGLHLCWKTSSWTDNSSKLSHFKWPICNSFKVDVHRSFCITKALMKSSCTRLKVWRSYSWSHSDPLAGLRAPSLRTAVLLLALLCFPQQVASDSDEAILTDWDIWKSTNGISYDDLVRHISSETRAPSPRARMCPSWP